jgi:hypothetical protein
MLPVQPSTFIRYLYCVLCDGETNICYILYNNLIIYYIILNILSLWNRLCLIYLPDILEFIFKVNIFYLFPKINLMICIER